MSRGKREDTRGEGPLARAEQQHKVARKSKENTGENERGRFLCKEHIASGKQRHQQAFAHAAQHEQVFICASIQMYGDIDQKRSGKKVLQSFNPPNSNGWV